MQDESKKDPSVIGRIQFPVKISALLVFLTVVIVAAYYFWHDGRPIITFAGASLAVASGLFVAYYRSLALRLAIRQNERIMQDEKIAKTFRFAERWNDPNFAPLRAKWRKLIVELEDQPPEQVIDILMSDLEKRTVTVDILNFFEEMGYSARSEISDLDSLRNIFKTIAVQYYTVTSPWIKRFRRDVPNSENAYEHFEWMTNKLSSE